MSWTREVSNIGMHNGGSVTDWQHNLTSTINKRCKAWEAGFEESGK